MKVIFTMLLVLASITAYVIQGRASEPSVVLSATAPVYPVIALAAHGSGDVVVVADINKSGDVTSARALSGHNLLKGASVEAAKRWRFAPSSEEHREAELTFTFSIVPDKTAGVDRTAVFHPPYHIEVRNERVVTTTNH